MLRLTVSRSPDSNGRTIGSAVTAVVATSRLVRKTAATRRRRAGCIGGCPLSDAAALPAAGQAYARETARNSRQRDHAALGLPPLRPAPRGGHGPRACRDAR